LSYNWPKIVQGLLRLITHLDFLEASLTGSKEFSMYPTRKYSRKLNV